MTSVSFEQRYTDAMDDVFGVERMTLCSEIELRTFSEITIFRSFVDFLMIFRVRGRNKHYFYLFIYLKGS